MGEIYPDRWFHLLTHHLLPPWLESAVHYHAVQNTTKEEPPLHRKVKALEFLYKLRSVFPPDSEAWTDGSAVGVTRKGGSGFVVRWPSGLKTTGSVPAGSVTSSTTAEATVTLAALGELAESSVGWPVWFGWLSIPMHFGIGSVWHNQYAWTPRQRHA